MSVGAELVVLLGAFKLIFAVHLWRRQTQHKARCTGVTKHALVATGIVPNLSPHTVCSLRIPELIRGIHALGPNQHGIRLLAVPTVGIA